MKRAPARTIGVLVKAALAAALLIPALAARAAPPGAPTNIVAVDDPDEPAGKQLIVRWSAPLPQEWPRGLILVGYRVFVALHESPEFTPGPLVPVPTPEQPLETSVQDLRPAPWPPYDVQVAAIYLPEGTELQTTENDEIANANAALIYSDVVGPVQPAGIWYDRKLTNVLILMIIFCAIVIVTIAWVARRAADVYIRPIAALEAVDDAIGRATEMGKPIVYVSGLSGIGDISTIASMLILGHLSRHTAYYETDIIVPCNDPLVMAAERDIMRQAYIAAGKPDAYKPQNIYFVTDSQFAYVAAVDGIMLREKPAAAFYMGYFFAESLILAETGNQSGAIQIAGTDADTQLPFFITACDYTLMGEELYAASAYLSRQPLLVAQLRGQDIGKTITAALVAVGTAAATWAAFGGSIAAKFVEWFAK